MKNFISSIMVAGLLFTGCDFGSISNALKTDTISSFNVDTMWNSIKVIRKDLTVEKRKEFDNAVNTIRNYHFYRILKDQDELMHMSKEEINRSLIDLLGGKTVDEVIKFAKEVGKWAF